jgi:hypothetical protein
VLASRLGPAGRDDRRRSLREINVLRIVEVAGDAFLVYLVTFRARVRRWAVPTAQRLQRTIEV